MLKYFLTVIFIVSLSLMLQSAYADQNEVNRICKEIQDDYAKGRINEALIKTNQLKSAINTQSLEPQKQTTNFDRLFEQTKSPLKLETEFKNILLHYGGNVFYHLKNNPQSFSSYYVLSEVNGRLAINNKYFKVNGDTKQIKYTSSDKKKLEVDNSGRIKFKKRGMSLLMCRLTKKNNKFLLKS